MAWFKGLADKAEDFLNQIDQNAAVALQSEKKGSELTETLLTEVTWDSSSPPDPMSDLTRSTIWSAAVPTSATMPTVRSSPNLSNLSPIRTPKKQKDEELINFLNSSLPVPNQEMQIQLPLSTTIQPETNVSIEKESYVFTPVKVESLEVRPQNSNNSQSSLSSSRRSTPQDILSDSVTSSVPQTMSSSGIVENGLSNGPTSTHLSDIQTENEMLRNELRTLNNEMSILLHRAKNAERDCQNKQQLLLQIQERADLVNELEQELSSSRQQLATFQEKFHLLEVENDKLVQAAADTTGNESYRALENEFNNAKSEHKFELSKMDNRLSKMEQERAGLEQQLSEVRLQLSQRDNSEESLQQQMERARGEAREARDELEQYRLRAQRILQDKEKLITELRGEGGLREEGQDETLILELQQLRQERELLREETYQITTRLQAARDELLEAEKRLETCREQASDTQHKLQESLAEERKKRQAAEEDCKAHSDELRSVRDELSRQRSLLATRVREREAELTRLRTQLSQRPASPTNGELESRLHALTQTLVQKQNTLETVTTEKNALRLQLEKMECKHQEMMTLVQQNQSGLITVSATDDARAQVPSFFVESPFDTGISRRVKRAYSSLDAVSIRTGVFLRRYPLARILVLCYMVLLHLWVMLVLFTYTPQAQ